MILLTDAQKEARKADLADAKPGRFDDLVTIEGTGVYAEMPKGVKYERQHRLVAEKLKEKGYAKIV